VRRPSPDICSDVDFGAEVPRIRHDGAVFHLIKMIAVDDVDVPRGGNENVANGRRAVHGRDGEAIHRRFQRTNRVDLGDDNAPPHAAGAHGDPLSAPPITGDDDRLAGQQDVRGAQDAVNRALPGPIAVVKKMLRFRIIDRDHRKP
jgi:hypothetical protein